VQTSKRHVGPDVCLYMIRGDDDADTQTHTHRMTNKMTNLLISSNVHYIHLGGDNKQRCQPSADMKCGIQLPVSSTDCTTLTLKLRLLSTKTDISDYLFVQKTFRVHTNFGILLNELKAHMRTTNN